MSLHHIKLVHGSGANASSDRRIGLAIRYIPTYVKQTKVRDSAILVRGADRDRDAAGDDAVGAEHADREVGDVHRAALALAVAVDPSEQLGHHAADVAAFRDAMAVAAMGAGDPVCTRQRLADADGDRLLAEDAGIRGVVGEGILTLPLGDLVVPGTEVGGRRLHHLEELAEGPLHVGDDVVGDGVTTFS